jgi:hypothetical protein
MELVSLKSNLKIEAVYSLETPTATPHMLQYYNFHTHS